MAKSISINWGRLLVGLLFIAAAILSFYNPASDLLALTIFFALVAIFKGVSELYFRSAIKKATGEKSGMLLFLGVFDIFVGLFILFNLSAAVVALPFVFAIWFSVSSIFALTRANFVKSLFGKGYYIFFIIINIIGIVVGVALFFHPLTSALTLAFLVGFYFMMYGIVNLIEAFNN